MNNMNKTCLVFLSWSLIFFSISASVSVSKNGVQDSASDCVRYGTSTTGNGDSLKTKHELLKLALITTGGADVPISSIKLVDVIEECCYSLFFFLQK